VPAPEPQPSDPQQSSKRWWIVGLLFLATTINYLDRGILGVLLPEIQKELQFTQAQYGQITFWFQFAYGIGALLGGKLLDAYGTRIGYGLAATFWSIAGALTAFASSATHFGILRMALGLAEAPNFPACNKAVAEWFPPAKTALAMGLINFGTNFASIIGPPLFVWIAAGWGWPACFAIMGALGFLWLPLWLWLTPKVAPTLPTSRLSFKAVLAKRAAWGYIWGKFLTDPVWWFYLFWLPTYLTDQRGMSATERAFTLSLIYAISGVGSLLGGAMSGYLIGRGAAVFEGRQRTMLACAILMPLSALGMVVESTPLAIALFGLGTAAHQAWSVNLLTTPADIFPKETVASANAVGVFAGAMGGALFSGLIPGYLLAPLGYAPILIAMSCFYLVAWYVLRQSGDVSSNVSSNHSGNDV
jgi:MFS transporter, ACS family, hexuronate transporter